MVLSLQPVFFPFDYTPSLTEKVGWHQFPKTCSLCESANLQESRKTQVTLPKCCLRQPFSFSRPQSHKTTPNRSSAVGQGSRHQEAGEESCRPLHPHTRWRRKAVLPCASTWSKHLLLELI